MDFAQARHNMVEQQIRPWDVLEFELLDVLSEIPREHFVLPEHQAVAYADQALPLANGKYALAALLLAAEFLPSDMKVQFKEPGRNGKEFGIVTADNDYRPIEQFLSRLGGQCWDSAQGWRSNQKVEDEEVRATWQ